MKKPIGQKIQDGRQFKTGRPRRLSIRDERKILQECEKLRTSHGHFTSRRVKALAGIDPTVSVETVRRVLRKNNMRYSHSRKKGVLKREDLKKRLSFARKVRGKSKFMDQRCSILFKWYWIYS